MLFVNLKTYKEGTGEQALKLVEALGQASAQAQIKVVPVLQAADIREATQTSTLEIWCQHVDPAEYGAHTGAVIPEAVADDGAMGVFLNHSERKYDDYDALAAAVERCRALNLKTLVFAADLGELRKIIKLKPDFASYEPPELVGSKTTSVAEAKPEIVSEAVKISHGARIPLIVGAGIKSYEDVRASVTLGADGVAVASSIVTAKNPKEETLKLLEGFK